MKKSLLLFLLFTMFLYANATNVSGTISSNTIWTTANSPYVVTSSITVNPGVSLTIESGVEVRFATGTYIVTKGTLNAENVTFTSNVSTSAGAWDALYFDTGSTENLSNINIMYATIPIRLRGVCNFNISGSNSFSSNTYQYVFLEMSTINDDFILPKIPIPYYTGNKTVNNGAKLTITAGNTIKFSYRAVLSIVEDASLEAIATESTPILFTSIRDADAGGYSEDGGVTANLWGGILFYSGDSTNNKMDYCTVRYAGNNYYNGARSAVVSFANSGVSLNHCIIEKAQRALFIESGATVSLKNSTLNGVEYPLAMRADGVLDVTNCDIDFTDMQYKAILLAGNINMTKNSHIKVISFNNAPNMAYANDNWVGVPNGITLTIDPGVVIKGFNTYGRINVSGKLIAEGTTDKPIIFTSIYDDNYGNPSDSNNDGVATSPVLGQWGGIMLQSVADATSSIKNCEFRYSNWPHGENFLNEAVYPHAALSVFDISPTIENCTFYECNYGIKTYGTAAPIIRTNSFENIKYTPIAINASSHPVLDNNTWGNNIKFQALGLMGQKTGSVGKVSKIDDAGYTNLTYLLLDNWTIPQGVNVEIDPGVVIKSNDAVKIYVHGGLKMVGTETEHIIFTEKRDDNFGSPADLEGDGNASAPAVNRWGGICYYNDCDNTFSQINYADFRYGGNNGLRDSYTYTSGINPLTNAANLHNTSRSGVLTFSRTAVNVKNTTFFTCGHGLAYYGPEATGTATNITIEKSDYMPIVQTWSAKPQFTNVTLIDNAYQGIYLQDNKIDYDITLGKTTGINGSNDNTNAVYLTSNLEFSEGITAQVNPGLIFKNNDAYPYNIKGTLRLNGTSDEHITFTSIHDDSKGGDTNNNGNATSPSAGNWGIYYSSFSFNNSTGNNNIKYVDIAYPSNGIFSTNSNITVEDCKIEQCSGKGISIEGTSNVVIRHTAFNNMQVPIRKNAFSTATIHEGNTASNVSIMGIELIGETFNTSGTLPLYTFAGYPDITYWITGTLTIGAGTTFTIPAGASFKRNIDNYLYNCFDVKGILNIEGTTDKPVSITDQREDTYGSPLDFNQDGTVTQNYGRFDRTFINFNSGSSGTLENLILKSNGYGISCTSASPVMRNVAFDNLGRGVTTTGVSSAPIIENSVFNNTTYPIETSLLCFPASLSGNTFSGTTYKGIKVLAETLNQNATLAPRAFGEMTNAPYIFENYTVNAELTIKPGVKCKFLDARSMLVNRWMKAIGTPDSVIVFTSIHDDFYGGDTNADSTVTAATGSHWYGISFADASIDADCKLKNVIIKNAFEALTATGASPSLDSVTFYTNRNAVQASGASNPVITNCDFVSQSQRAVNNINQSFTIQATNCWWGNSAGPVIATVPTGTQQAISAGVNYTPFRRSGLNQPLIGDVSTNGTIQAYDASLVLQAAVNNITLDAQQTLAADASGDGSITAYDATLILEYVAGINSNMPGGLKAPQRISSSPSLIIGSGSINREADLLLPLEIKNIPTSVGADIILSYNPNLVQAVEVLPAAGTNFMQATRIDNEKGRIYIAAASTNGQVSDAWNIMRFRVSDKAKTDFKTDVSAELFLVNESDKTNSTTNGTVIFRTPTGFNALQEKGNLYCFPNPAADIMYLLGVQNGAKVSIYNTSGQMIQTTSLTDNKINVSKLNSGLYFISVNENGNIQKAKFLKK